MKRKGVKPGGVEELSSLYPVPQHVTVRVRDGPDADTYSDEQIAVVEMDIQQIAHAAQVLAPIQGLATDSLLLLATKHPDQIFAAVGIAIRWPAERVALLAASSFAAVLAKVYEVNQGFFAQAIALAAYGQPAILRGDGDGVSRLTTSVDTATFKTPSASH